MKPQHGDVAELADAQVSEACDGDIVEVQVLSSPPEIQEAIRVYRLAFCLNGVAQKVGLSVREADE